MARVRGYAGKKFVGKRRIDFPTPGMPKKGTVWAGLYVDPTNPPAEVRTANAARAARAASNGPA